MRLERAAGEMYCGRCWTELDDGKCPRCSRDDRIKELEQEVAKLKASAKVLADCGVC